MNIEVIRNSDDLLNSHAWRFRLIETEIRLTQYIILARETKRHKYKLREQWDSRDERSYHSRIKWEDVPLPADIIAEAKQQVIDKLEVKIR